MRNPYSYRGSRRNSLRRSWQRGPFHAVAMNPLKPNRLTFTHATYGQLRSK